GQSLAFIASSAGGNTTLWVRSLDSLQARQLPGTEGGVQPFWSPDSRFIGFSVGGGKLKKIDVSGGTPQTLADGQLGRGTWHRDGSIIFPSGGQTGRGLSRFSAAGQPLTSVTTLDPARGETNHGWPQVLPDGRHFIYMARSTQPQY